MIRLIFLALAAAAIGWAADVCIDDECFPDSPPISPARVERVYLPAVWR